VRLKIVIRDPLGYEQEFEIERIWLLVIIDVCTRAVLGYHLVLSREYSRYDVIKTIEQALTPHRPRLFTLPGVGYGAAGGFPSGKLPELGYAIWERVRLDNAKANLAGDTMVALCEFIGCAADAGPPHRPDDRPYIERFFVGCGGIFGGLGVPAQGGAEHSGQLQIIPVHCDGMQVARITADAFAANVGLRSASVAFFPGREPAGMLVGAV